MVMPYHLHMPSYFLETFTEYPFIDWRNASPGTDLFVFYNIQICLASYKENVIIRKASCRYTRFSILSSHTRFFLL